MPGASTGLTLQYEKGGRGKAVEQATTALETRVCVCASGSELGQGRAGAAAPPSAVGQQLPSPLASSFAAAACLAARGASRSRQRGQKTCDGFHSPGTLVLGRLPALPIPSAGADPAE